MEGFPAFEKNALLRALSMEKATSYAPMRLYIRYGNANESTDTSQIAEGSNLAKTSSSNSSPEGSLRQALLAGILANTMQ